MISPLINSIVIALFGFVIGMLLQIATIVFPERSRRLMRNAASTQRRGWQGFLDRFSPQGQEEQRELNREFIRDVPPQFWISTCSFYALIAIMSLVLWFSPLKMSWIVFFIAFFTGYSVLQWIFNRAQKGKLSPTSSSPDDSPPITSMNGE